MEASRVNPDRFEPPSGAQLSELARILEDRLEQAEVHYLVDSDSLAEICTLEIKQPERFSYTPGFAQQPFLSVGYDSRLETPTSFGLFLATQSKSIEDSTEIYEYYFLSVWKADKTVRDVFRTSIEPETYEEHKDEINVLEELERGKCDAAEVERLIRMLTDASPTPVIDDSDQGKGILD